MIFATLSALLANLIILVVLKYDLPTFYVMNAHKLPHFFPKDFCLLCTAFWTGVGTALIMGTMVGTSVVNIIMAVLLTVPIVIVTNK